ncbi:MAG: SIR2 family protein, partial [Pseudomonadota bacterium]
NGVLLTGAGISIPNPANLPNWSSFSTSLVSALCQNAEAVLGSELTRSVSDALEDVTPELVMSVARLTDRDLQTLMQPFLEGRPNALHEGIASAASEQKLKVLITTNYDNYLERAFSHAKIRFDCLRTERDFASWLSGSNSDRHVIAKLHGCASAPDSLRMNKANLQGGLSAVKTEFLRRVLVSKHLFVLGYSGADLMKGHDHLSLQYLKNDIQNVTWNIHGGKNAEIPTPLKRLAELFEPGKVRPVYGELATSFANQASKTLRKLFAAEAGNSQDSIGIAVRKWSENELSPIRASQIVGSLLLTLGQVELAERSQKITLSNVSSNHSDRNLIVELLGLAQVLEKAQKFEEMGTILDRVEQFPEEAVEPADSVWIKALRISNLRHTGRLLDALTLLEKTIPLAERQADAATNIRLRHAKAQTLLAMKHIDKTLEELDIAITLSRKSGEFEYIPGLLTDKALSYKAIGEVEKAKQELEECKATALKWNDGEEYACSLVRLNSLEYQSIIMRGDDSKSEFAELISPCEEALQAMTPFSHSLMYAEAHRNMAEILYSAGETERSEHHGLIAWENAQTPHLKWSVAQMLSEFIYSDDWPNQKKFLELAIKYGRDVQDPSVFLAYFRLAEGLEKSDQSDQALRNYKRALVELRKSDQYSWAPILRKSVRRLNGNYLVVEQLTEIANEVGFSLDSIDTDEASLDKACNDVLQLVQPRAMELASGGALEPAVSLTNKSIELAKIWGDDAFVAGLINLKAQLCVKAGALDKAADLYMTSINLSYQLEDLEQERFCRFNLAETYLAMVPKYSNKTELVRLAISSYSHFCDQSVMLQSFQNFEYAKGKISELSRLLKQASDAAGE